VSISFWNIFYLNFKIVVDLSLFKILLSRFD